MDFRPHDFHKAHSAPVKPHHVLIILFSLYLCLIDISEARELLDAHMQYGITSLLLGFVSVIGELGE